MLGNGIFSSIINGECISRFGQKLEYHYIIEIYKKLLYIIGI